jgi:hypothetical protein
MRTKFDFYVLITITRLIPLLVDYQSPEVIILPVVSASSLTWFIRYIYYWNVQFLNNVIMIKKKLLVPVSHASVTLAEFGCHI